MKTKRPYLSTFFGVIVFTILTVCFAVDSKINFEIISAMLNVICIIQLFFFIIMDKLEEGNKEVKWKQ